MPDNDTPGRTRHHLCRHTTTPRCHMTQVIASIDISLTICQQTSAPSAIARCTSEL